MKKILAALLSSSLLFVSACSREGHQMTAHSSEEVTPHDMTEMNLGSADTEFDLRFIDAMTLHHQGAIEMANQAVEKSSRAELRALAQEMIAAQQQEINQMQQWRRSWYANASSEPIMYHAEMQHSMPMSAEVQASMKMNVDLGAADANFDRRFINAMIPHHEGAVTMAQAALENSSRLEVKQLAEAILDAQQPEIDQMRQWRRSWYGE